MENKQTVLIVDDIADNLNVVANILIQENINVLLAQSGKEALVIAGKLLPDLILLDIMMPEMNGFEVCEKLKANNITKDIPLIFLTAVSDAKNIVKGFKQGGVDYINKPFIPEELISRVFAHLKVHKLNKDLNLKNIEIKHKHDEILASMKYAKIIQNSLLPKQGKIDEIFNNNYFIFFKPKEIVSGDFYFVNKFGKNTIFAVADCTGHGIPGGFLSMLGITYLNQVVGYKEINSPAKALESLRKFIKNTFDNTESKNNGMDIALCAIDSETNNLMYSGANLPLFIIREGEIMEFKPTKNPIGNYMKELPFKNIEIQLKKNDCIYLFSDGYADQFGGKEDKKYKIKQFKELLISISDKPINKQKKILGQTFNDWKTDKEQTDDVLVMGLMV